MLSILTIRTKCFRALEDKTKDMVEAMGEETNGEAMDQVMMTTTQSTEALDSIQGFSSMMDSETLKKKWIIHILDL